LFSEASKTQKKGGEKKALRSRAKIVDRDSIFEGRSQGGRARVQKRGPEMVVEERGKQHLFKKDTSLFQ